MIDGIARAANEQATVSEAVAVAMGQISEITRQTNAGTQEAAASVSYLSELSEQLRASVSTFRLPDRGDETMDIFPGMTSVTALHDGNADLVGVGVGMDNDWGQSFSMNFPPLSEPRNSPSVAALTAHAGQFPFGNSQPDFAGQQSFASQQNFGRQQSFTNQPNFGGQQPFSNQPNFGEQQTFSNQPNFGGQQPFSNQPSFGEQQSFSNQPSFGGQQQFGGLSGFDEFGDFERFNGQPPFGQQFGNIGGGLASQSQPLYAQPNQPSFSQQPNSPQQSQQQSGQAGQASRQRRLGGPQQNQPSYDQDQWSFPNNSQ